MSVITPTCGRATLFLTLASVLPQLERGDEWVVVGDGRQPEAAAMCRLARERTRAKVVYAETVVEGSRFGNGQRDYAIQLSQGSHVCFLDDDDVYEPRAVAAFRRAADKDPHAVHVFKAEWGPGHHAHGTVLWDRQEFVEGNVGTPMLVVPRAGLHAWRWMDGNDRGVVSDFAWMRSVAAGREVRWHEQVVATVRP